MAEPKILVVYYSRGGTTRKLAAAIADALHADIAAIGEPHSRGGVAGYLRSIVEARRRRPADILPLGRDPGSYDLVVIGTPVWAWSVSSPVRAFLLESKHALRNVAFFCTCGASGQQSVFAQMKNLAGKAPLGVLGTTQRDIESGRYRQPFAAFVATLRADIASAKRDGPMVASAV